MSRKHIGLGHLDASGKEHLGGRLSTVPLSDYHSLEESMPKVATTLDNDPLVERDTIILLFY
jgi:hypothetical protein